MILKQIEVQSKIISDYTNCYILQDEETKETMCIDPGGSIEKIKEMLHILNSKLKYIFLTHTHYDHIQEVANLKNEYNCEVLTSRNGSENINNPNITLSAYFNIEQSNVETKRVDDEDILHIGNIELKVIYTPGHTNDGMSLYCEKENIVFTGDTLMCRACGRTDLPTSNKAELKKSLKKIFLLPDNTFVYSGHGVPTMIKDERR